MGILNNLIDKALKKSDLLKESAYNVRIDYGTDSELKQKREPLKRGQKYKDHNKNGKYDNLDLPLPPVDEATVSALDNKFNLRTGVNKNPTKLGIKIQFEPKGGLIAPDTKSQLEVALQEKLNTSLSEFNIQVSKDTDVPRENTIGFFIPLSQIKNLIVSALSGKKSPSPSPKPKPTPKPAVPPTPPTQLTPPAPKEDEKDSINEMIDEQLLLEAMRVKDLNEISSKVYKEDFYGFINAGQNILRTADDHGMPYGKKYLEHLVKHNII